MGVDEFLVVSVLDLPDEEREPRDLGPGKGGSSNICYRS